MAFLSLSDELKTRREEIKLGKRDPIPLRGYATEAWGTSNRFKHYPQIQITRASIDRANKDREERGLQPYNTPAAIVYAFVSVPEPRHFKRAERLFNVRIPERT